MDIKSIVRVFRFNELQSRAERDPDAKRPPTVKFMGVALALGVLLVMISFWTAPKTDLSGAVPLNMTSTDPVPDTNQTADETSTPATPQPQSGPSQGDEVARADERD